MDIELISYNVKKMLEHRLNGSNIKFSVVFKNFKQSEPPKKLAYTITTELNEGYNITYTLSSEFFKIVYVNASINKMKNSLNNPSVIILYNKGNRKISQLMSANTHKCEFLCVEYFYNDYRRNVYFTHCCKSKENIDSVGNIQHISSTDFNVLYNGLKEGDVMFSLTIVDPTLMYPQLRIVKNV